MARNATHTDFARLLVAYAKQEDPPADGEFVIPEDLSTLTDEELTALHAQAAEHFDAIYGDGTGLSEEDLAALATLTEGIETLLTEVTARATKATERSTQAAELAARAHPELSVETEDGPKKPALDADGNPVLDKNGNPLDEDGNVIVPADPEAEPNPDGAAAVIVASSKPRGDIRVSLGSLRSRQVAVPRPAHQAQTMRDVVLASGEGSGFAQGTGLDWLDVGKIVDRRLSAFNQTQYANANRSGTHLRQQFGVATIRKPFPPELIVHSNDPGHVDEVLRRAMDESRLPGGSLVASGGWCAPSETLYDLCELESNDGLLSVPEIGISRGGISWTTGPKFSDIYNGTGFCYTEQDDIDGDYDGSGGGSKPCYTVTCPPFQEARLGLCGLCISAGLLQSRGYPEVIARTTRGALIAHDHKMSASVINAIVAGSTAVTMTAAQAGATAPLLDAIELQVEHYRYSNRMSRSTSLEAVFPYWVHGVVRADLSRRQGLDLLSVTDAQIDGWFRQRGINPQFVYDWQDINGTAATAFKSWPTSLKFLLYAAGTWVKGTSDIITVDTLYDSVLLGTNDYTALFTEEGWLVAKLCEDSRVITIDLCPDGATHGGIDIACDGTTAPAIP